MTDSLAEPPSLFHALGSVRTGGRSGAIAILIGAVAFFGVELSRHAGSIPTVWPVNGLLLAILLTEPAERRRASALTGLLAIAGGVFLSAPQWETGIRLSLVNACEVVLAFVLARRAVGWNCDLSRPRNLRHFVVMVVLVAPASAAVLNAALRPPSNAGTAIAMATSSFFAHALGLVIVTPVSLVLCRRKLLNVLAPGQTRSTILAFAVLIGITVLVFAQSRYPLLFLVLPPLVAVVLFQGFSGGSLGLLITTLVAIVFTAAGRGPMGMIHGATALERGLVLQLFAGVAAGLVLVLSAVLAERDRALQQLESATDGLSRLATTDSLTGLANRRRLDEVLNSECHRAQREGVPLSFLLLDVDRFKAFNDVYGHQAGDQCLAALASTLMPLCRRPGDLVARYGGEEFAILLPGTDQKGALEVAERLRATIAALATPHAENDAGDGVVTVSIGCATATPQGLAYDPKTLIGAADAFLYEAKRTGRNRVKSIVSRPMDAVPPSASNEDQRLAAVRIYLSKLGGGTSPDLDDIARLAAMLFDAPIGFVSMVDRDHLVFVGRHGLANISVARDIAFCSHTIAGDGPLVVPDASADPRFKNNPLVVGDLGFRFYAGAPLVSPQGGHRLGALCVMDVAEHKPLSADQRAQLMKLSEAAMSALEVARTHGAAGGVEASAPTKSMAEGEAASTAP